MNEKTALNQEFKMAHDGFPATFTNTMKNIKTGEMSLETVQGYIYWPFAIYKVTEPRGWALTHLPTGLGFYAIKRHHSKSRKDIVALIERLRQGAVDWDMADISAYGKEHFHAWNLANIW